MKQAMIIIVAVCAVVGTSFTVVQSNKQPVKKTGYCCKKVCPGKQEKKTTTPATYFPIVNIL